MSASKILPVAERRRRVGKRRFFNSRDLTPDNAVELTAKIRRAWQEFSEIEFTHIPVATETQNLGDDIQSEAAARFWGVRKFVNRDRLGDWPSDAIVPLIGWYSNRPLVPAAARCVVVGFHLENKSREAFAAARFRDWFGSQVREQGFPAQCRDLATRDFVRSVGIDAEFSGCVTYTLAPYDGRRDERAIIVDAKVPWRWRLSRKLPQEDRSLSKASAEERLAAASERIEHLARAKHVHTIRLHTLLPCRAMGTPVTFYSSQVCFQPNRFSGHLV